MLDDAPLAFAFGSGMVAAFNPCGFAMLPAYMAWFLGVDSRGDGPPRPPGVLRSLAVGGVVSVGFVAVFALVGFLYRSFSVAYGEYTPYVTIALGLLLIPLGAALALGRQLKIKLPTFQRAPKDRTLGAMFLFGVSYATVSLSCTLPTFIGPVAASLRGSFASGVAVFLAYSAGMGVILMSLTLSLGLARGSLVRHFRRALPYVGRVSGVLLILAGAYVAYYGWVEYEVVIQGRTVSAGPVDWVTEQADSIVRWITEMGEHRVGLVLASTLAVAAGAVFLRSRSRRRLA